MGKTTAPPVAPVFPREMNTENYAAVAESRFLPAADNPRSTFSIDVDAASYTNVCRFLTSGQQSPRDAVRVEEFLNYFRYESLRAYVALTKPGSSSCSWSLRSRPWSSRRARSRACP